MIPKFRAWDKEQKFMMLLESIDFESKLINVNSVGRKFYEIELMQSTGLKGYISDEYENTAEKDIFKGDIIDIF